MKIYFLILLSLLFYCIKSYALDPYSPPGFNFDLSAWKLQTLDNSYNFTEITALQLMSGYTSSLFFTDETDGSIVCKVPSSGATTSGSGYPRVEFRQMTNGANWKLTDPTEHYLNAECKVVAVAEAKPQTIIGQIHGSATNSELLKLRWTGYQPKQCKIEARYELNDATQSEYGVTLADGLSLGDLINYTITMKSGTITCTVNNVSASQTYTSAYFGTTDAYYFKAGNYFQYNNQTVPDPTIIFGQNQFYKLTLINSNPSALESHNTSNIKIYPNPAIDRITINCELRSKSNIKLTICELNGKVVRILFNEPQTAGHFDRSFSVSDLNKGIYLMRFVSDSFSKTTSIIIGK